MGSFSFLVACEGSFSFVGSLDRVWPALLGWIFFRVLGFLFPFPCLSFSLILVFRVYFIAPFCKHLLCRRKHF